MTRGFHTDSARIPRGIHLDSIWIPHGFRETRARPRVAGADARSHVPFPNNPFGVVTKSSRLKERRAGAKPRKNQVNPHLAGDGVNAYAVQDLVIKQTRAERAKQTAAVQRARRDRALRVIAERVPDLAPGGRPDDWAVWTLIELWGIHGDGNVAPSLLRSVFEQRKAERIDRLGFDPWEDAA